MGTSLMSEDEKLAYQAVINDLAKTFERPLVMYKTPEKVIASTNPNYNFTYGDNQLNGDVASYIVNSGVFNARISAVSAEQANIFAVQNVAIEGRLEQAKNIVKIKLEASGAAFIKEAKFIDLDGDRYIIISPARKHGLFYPEYSTIYLQRTD